MTVRRCDNRIKRGFYPASALNVLVIYFDFPDEPLPDFGCDGALPLPPPDLPPVVDGQLPPLLGLLDDGPFEVFLDM